MIHLSQLEHDALKGHQAEADRLAAVLLTKQKLLNDATAALKVLIAAVPNPLHPARMQGQAVIDLVELGHVPRRPMAELLEREAVAVGAGLDCESLEQAEVSL